MIKIIYKRESNRCLPLEMQASMLEIYNETIRDLLVISKIESQKADAAAAAKLHNIKHDPLGHTNVSELTLVEVTNWKEVSALLRQAAQSRLGDRYSLPLMSNNGMF